MSFLLCHDCYTWVEPVDDRCPDCQLVMDLSEADPPAGILREVIGELVLRLGGVRIPRRRLPEWGTLYATTQGLFFYPCETDSDGTGSIGLKRGGSLLRFLLPFLPSVNREPAPSAIGNQTSLLEREHVDLPALLMDNPGTFFLPRGQIQTITCKRSRWTIERTQGGRIVLWPAEPARSFQTNFRTLLELPQWRMVPHASRRRFLSFPRRTVSQS